MRKTYVDLVRFLSLEYGDDCLPSASLPNGDLFGSMSQGSQEGWKGEGGVGSMAWRPEDGHTFKQGYLRPR